MLNVMRYGGVLSIYFILSCTGVVFGGSWAWIVCLILISSEVLLDNLLPLDKQVHTVTHPLSLNLLLYSHLPAALFILYLLIWQAAPGDLFQTGEVLAALFGPWVVAERPLSMGDLIPCAFVVALMLGTNTIAAHELSHRLSNKAERFLAQCLLAITFDAQFVISHVHGHHATVGTDADAATAKRGETLYAFVIRSSLGQYRESFEIEQKRLTAAGLSFWSIQNRLLVGLLMSLVVCAVFYLLAGWTGLGLYFLVILTAKFLFETVNYVQHYGLIRKPGTKIAPHHSWDSMAWASTNTFYALSRHSHHHTKPILPFWQLQAAEHQQQVPFMKYGYLGEMIIALIPPIWFAHTSPQLLEWDKHMASEEEAELAKEANSRSGLKGLH